MALNLLNSSKLEQLALKGLTAYYNDDHNTKTTSGEWDVRMSNWSPWDHDMTITEWIADSECVHFNWPKMYTTVRNVDMDHCFLANSCYS